MSEAETPTPNAFDIKQEAGKKTEALVFNPAYAQDLEKNADLKDRVDKSTEKFKDLVKSVNNLADSKLGIDIPILGYKVLEGTVGIDEHNQIVREGETLLEELRSQHISKLKSVMDLYAKGSADPIGLDAALAAKVATMDKFVSEVVKDGNIDLGMLRVNVETRRKSPEQLQAESGAREDAAAKKATDEAAAKEAARKAAEPQKPKGRFEGVEGMENEPGGYMKQRGTGEGTIVTGPENIK